MPTKRGKDDLRSNHKTTRALVAYVKEKVGEDSFPANCCDEVLAIFSGFSVCTGLVTESFVVDLLSI